VWHEVKPRGHHDVDWGSSSFLSVKREKWRLIDLARVHPFLLHLAVVWGGDPKPAIKRPDEVKKSFWVFNGGDSREGKSTGIRRGTRIFLWSFCSEEMAPLRHYAITPLRHYAIELKGVIVVIDDSMEWILWKLDSWILGIWKTGGEKRKISWKVKKPCFSSCLPLVTFDSNGASAIKEEIPDIWLELKGFFTNWWRKW